MTELTRASLSIERELMERFDEFVAHSGHTNRSAAMRELIRARLIDEAWGDDVEEAMATVTILYDHHQRRISEQIEEHGHEHHDVVLSSLHIHVSEALCLEVVILRGEPAELKHVANHLIGLPGVLHGRAVYTGPQLVEGT